MQRQLEASSYRLRNAQDRVTTSDSLPRPSVDPAGYSRKLGLETELAGLANSTKQLTAESQRLNGYDSVLDDLTQGVRSARLIAQRADNAATDPQALVALASEVDRLREGALLSANREVNGRYLLSGTKTDQPAFAADGTYQGDRNFPSVRLPDGNALKLEMHGEAVAGDMFATLTALKDDLAKGDTSRLSTHIANLSKAEDNLLTRRGELGAAAGYLDRLQASHSDRQNQLTSELTEVAGADMAASITAMMSAETQQQAVLSVAARRTKLSLIDYLR